MESVFSSSKYFNSLAMLVKNNYNVNLSIFQGHSYSSVFPSSLRQFIVNMYLFSVFKNLQIEKLLKPWIM